MESIFVKSSVCQAVQSIRATGPSIVPVGTELAAASPPAPPKRPRQLEHHCHNTTKIPTNMSVQPLITFKAGQCELTVSCIHVSRSPSQL